MSTPTLMKPAPGWYKDPGDQNMLRYYDGSSWTAHTRPNTPAPAQPSGGVSSSPKAGWYADPQGNESLLRYHDGTQWTHQVAPAPRKKPVSEVTSPVAASRPTLPPLQTPASLSAAEDEDENSMSILERIRTLMRPNGKMGANLLVVVGVVSALFLSWNLYGVNIWNVHAQQDLQEDMAAAVPSASVLVPDSAEDDLGFEASSPAPEASAAPSEAPVPEATTPAPVETSAAPAPAPAPAQQAAKPAVKPASDTGVGNGTVLPAADGKPVARIRIPSIGVNEVVVSGTSVPALKKGPGIWRDGVFPGLAGNATISGHRTTYGGPFRKIDKLKVGDHIIVSVVGQPDAVFEVRGNTKVKPSRVEVTYPTPGVRLTLTTCDPVGKASERLVVQAELVEGANVSQSIGRDVWKFQS